MIWALCVLVFGGDLRSDRDEPLEDTTEHDMHEKKELDEASIRNACLQRQQTLFLTAITKIGSSNLERNSLMF